MYATAGICPDSLPTMLMSSAKKKVVLFPMRPVKTIVKASPAEVDAAAQREATKATGQKPCTGCGR